MGLTKRQLAVLSWAVREAEAWRGAVVGNPDQTELMEFDMKIIQAKEAMKQLRKERAKCPA